MEIELSYKYSELDKVYHFGLVFNNDEQRKIYVRWTYFYLGHYLGIERLYRVYPFAVGGKVRKYKYCNDAQRQAKMLANAINKIVDEHHR